MILFRKHIIQEQKAPEIYGDEIVNAEEQSTDDDATLPHLPMKRIKSSLI
jgi:hypothetical protein